MSPPSRTPPRRRFSALGAGILGAWGTLVVGCDETARPPGDPSAPVNATAADDRGLRETPPLSPELAEIFALIGDYRTGPARVRLVKHQKLHPDDGHAAFLFGLTYHREKRYRKALEHFERAAALAPDYSPTHHFLGWALLYLGEADAARAAFERHLAAQPRVADSHFAIGLLDLDRDDLDAAEERFRTAIALEEAAPSARPRDLAKAYAQLGEVHARRGELAEARSALERAVSIFPDHYEAHYRLYRVLVRLGADDAAAAALERHQSAKARLQPGTSFPE